MCLTLKGQDTSRRRRTEGVGREPVAVGPMCQHLWVIPPMLTHVERCDLKHVNVWAVIYLEKKIH